MAFSVIKTAAALLIILLCLFNAWEAQSVTGQRWPPEQARQLRSPVPPSERNPCTNIPGQGHGRCTLEKEEKDGNYNDNDDNNKNANDNEDDNNNNNDNENSGSSAFPSMNFDGSMAASVANQTQLEAASVANQTQQNHSLSS